MPSTLTTEEQRKWLFASFKPRYFTRRHKFRNQYARWRKAAELPHLSRAARSRLEWIIFWEKNGKDVSLTAILADPAAPVSPRAAAGAFRQPRGDQPPAVHAVQCAGGGGLGPSWGLAPRGAASVAGRDAWMTSWGGLPPDRRSRRVDQLSATAGAMEGRTRTALAAPLGAEDAQSMRGNC